MNLCPDCETVLTYPEKCPCGWFMTVDVPAEPVLLDLVKDRLVVQAKQEASDWDEVRGIGQREFEPRCVEHKRREALEALKSLRIK